MNKEKLQKYALNEITDRTEIEEVVRWIESSEENHQEFNRIKNLWSYSTFVNYDSLSNLLEDTSEKRQKLRKINFKSRIIKYSAVLVLSFLLGGGFVYFVGKPTGSQLAYNEVIVPYGESAEVILPDKTHVLLNPGSHLVYSSSFNNSKRDVQLSGEAMFEVVHNAKVPFQVHTSNLVVEVLGTTFNVEAYKNADQINVTLVDGAVNVQNNSGQVLAKLNPNQRMIYRKKTGSLTLDEMKPDYYSLWKNGVYNYVDESLSEIAEKLERMYNVKIVFDDKTVRQVKYTGSILKNKPIDQILDVFKYTASIDYSIEVRDNRPNLIHLKKSDPKLKRE